MNENKKIIEREDLPMVAINLLTKNRTELAVRTIHQAMRHLKYEGKLVWFVSDNGSNKEHMDRIRETIPEKHQLGSIYRTGNIGACWNFGLREIFKRTEYYIRLEDDMCLKEDLDITRYVKLMMSYYEIGMLRLGQMVENLMLHSEKFKIYTHIGFEEDVLLRVGVGAQYCFSGHPALLKQTFHRMYGYYSEEPISAGELEVAMDYQVRHGRGPGVYFPWDLGKFGTWGAWDHVGTVKAE